VDVRLAPLQAGEPLIFAPPPSDREETPEEVNARTIPASLLEGLVSERNRVVSRPVSVSNAVIDGPLNLQNARFECEFSVTGSRFKGDVNFNFAVFQRTATLKGSQFDKRASFRAVHAEGDFDISSFADRTRFADEADFRDLHAKELLNADSAIFNGKVLFGRIDVGKDASFCDAEFHEDARFNNAHFRCNAVFCESQFQKRIFFDGVQVDGGVAFRRFLSSEGKRDDQSGRRVTFGGEARFLGVRIRTNAEFQEADFRAAAMFDGAQVDGNAFFSSDETGQHVTFGGETTFPAVSIHGVADFSDVEFKAKASFGNAHFQGEASFTSAVFAKESETVFVGACFERDIGFDRAAFKGKTDFSTATAKCSVSFLGATFCSAVSFRDGDFQGVCFEPTQEVHSVGQVRGPAHFGDRCSLDLLGFVYRRIYVSLKALLPRIAGSERQPYAQLEHALRNSGDDERADEVYLTRRRIERRRMFSEGHWLRWFADFLYFWIGRYGVRPYRLGIYALLLVLIGTVIFLQPHNLQPKDGKPNPAPAAASSNPAGNLHGKEETPDAGGSFSKNFTRALGVSVHEFLPAEVPVGSNWVPVPGWPSVYATVCLRLFGSILVGIGIGSVTKLLRRVNE